MAAGRYPDREPAKTTNHLVEGRFANRPSSLTSPGSFVLEEPPLIFETPSVAGEFAVRADCPMARNHERERIRPIGVAYRTRGVRPSELACNLAVRSSASGRNRAQLTPYS